MLHAISPISRKQPHGRLCYIKENKTRGGPDFKLAGYISSQLSGRQDNVYKVEYPAGYRLSGRIPDIQP